MSEEVNETVAPAKHELLERIKAVLQKEGFIWATPEGLASDRAKITDDQVTSRIGIIWPGRTRAEVESRWDKFWREVARAIEWHYRPPRRAFLGRLTFEGESHWYLTFDETRGSRYREAAKRLAEALERAFKVDVMPCQPSNFLLWPMWEE